LALPDDTCILSAISPATRHERPHPPKVLLQGHILLDDLAVALGMAVALATTAHGHGDDTPRTGLLALGVGLVG
jgi:hypothetical protein